MSSENNKYAVVKFLLDSTYSEIPTAWLFTDKGVQKCWWPPRTANCATLITTCANPDCYTWNSHEVDIVKLCMSLKSARKNAADSNYDTTDDERLGRGKRQHVPNNYFNSDEEEEEHVSQPRKYSKKKQTDKGVVPVTLPSCPSNFNYIIEDSNILNNNESNMQIIAPSCSSNVEFIEYPKVVEASNASGKKNITLHNEEENDSFMTYQPNQYSNMCNVPMILQGNAPSSENVEDNFNIKGSIQQMLRMQAASNITLKDVQRRLLNIETTIKRRALSPATINDNLITPFLPLTTTEVIKEFDALLKTSHEAVTQFKEFLSKIGGSDARNNIHRILKKTLTNECSMKCSWKGLRNNFRVSNLHLIQIMKRDVISRYVTCTESDFENIIAEWLRFATQRNKKDKAKENIDGNNIDGNDTNNI